MNQFTDKSYLLSNEQQEWFAERIIETKTGRYQVRKYLVNKYRKITNDNDSPDWYVQGVIQTMADKSYHKISRINKQGN